MRILALDIQHDPTTCATLGDAIMAARNAYTDTGTPHTVVLVDGAPDPFGFMQSASYAHLREHGQHEGITPLLTFRRGGLDAHRDSFRSIAAALTARPTL